MKKPMLILSACILFCLHVAADSTQPVSANALTISEIHYEGRLSGDEALFTLNIAADATGASSTQLLQGEIAVLPSKLPSGLEIVREDDRYLLVADRPGHYNFKFPVVAKIKHDEPWNQISFIGPAATIASVTAQAAGEDTDVQLLNGTLLEAAKTNGFSRVTGFLGRIRRLRCGGRPRLPRLPTRHC